MKKEDLNILGKLSNQEIISILNNIGGKIMTESAHGYAEHKGKTILEASLKALKEYSDLAKKKPAVALILVVLAANRNYNMHVQNHINRIEEDGLKDFAQLSEILRKKSKNEFYDYWGPKDEKKYNTLKNILEGIKTLKISSPEINNDYELMNKWGTKADLFHRKDDILGKIPNVGIATFQHLRMVFGVNTVKPDRRVKEVLCGEFHFQKITDIEAIRAVEQIAKISGRKVITVDQILVKYGSGYYNKNAKKINEKSCHMR
ncbi:MAG: hypothetical protein M0P58_08895 [Bacteroidales bacterium]|nr:hypothetical protein [Bacteroidales bacterium]